MRGLAQPLALLPQRCYRQGRRRLQILLPMSWHQCRLLHPWEITCIMSHQLGMPLVGLATVTLVEVRCLATVVVLVVVAVHLPHQMAVTNAYSVMVLLAAWVPALSPAQMLHQV